MNQYLDELRSKYIKNPLEGMTSADIRSMSNDALLDMDYFLNENDFDDDEIGEEGFYIFYSVSSYSYACLLEGIFNIRLRRRANFPIKQKRLSQEQTCHSLTKPNHLTTLLLFTHDVI